MVPDINEHLKEVGEIIRRDETHLKWYEKISSSETYLFGSQYKFTAQLFQTGKSEPFGICNQNIRVSDLISFRQNPVA